MQFLVIKKIFNSAYHNMDLIRRCNRRSMVQQFLETDLGHNMVPWPMTNPQELCNDSLSSKT